LSRILVILALQLLYQFRQNVRQLKKAQEDYRIENVVGVREFRCAALVTNADPETKEQEVGVMKMKKRKLLRTVNNEQCTRG
jgi:hypothetical protein